MTFAKSFLLSAILIFGLAASRPSQAAIGYLAGVPALVVSGIVTASGASVVGVTGALFEDGDVLRISFILGFIGLIFLDSEQTIEFVPLDANEASKLKITSSERQSFNREIDQVNALVSYATEELTLIQHPTPKDSKDIWQRLKAEVAPETYSALTKIVNQAKH